MINKLQGLYTEGVEDFCTRLLYFMNTIDTYFLIAGFLSFAIVRGPGMDIPASLLLLLLSYLCFKTVADFYPSFILLTPIYLLLFHGLSNFNYSTTLLLLMVNIAIFVVIQFLFMGIPDSIVSRDATVPFRKLWLSLFTIAPTTVSFCMSVYFSTLLSMVLMFQPLPREKYGLALWSSLFVGALVARFRRPRSFVSKNFKPKPPAARKADRIILLNIDGVRLDRFYEANLPFLNSIRSEATYFPSGLQTVYRALTNPAFVSILSGTTPDVHGIISNNISTGIKVQCLPDIVKTRLYGSMHVKHFSKKTWSANIVSLPRHSIYRSDDIMFDLLKEDMLKKDGTRLFIADLSEVDFLGHAYGSESKQYLDALQRADKRIEGFFSWLRDNRLFDGTIVIISSDHGIVRIDHSYLLFDAEKYVPFYMLGTGIKKDNALKYEASIMDINPTICYALGVDYLDKSNGRVFLEAFS